MVKSAIAGAFTGAFISAVSLGAASLIAPQPAGNTPPAPPQQQAPDAQDPGAIAATPTTGESPVVDAAPSAQAEAVPAVGAGGQGAAPGIDTSPAPAPGVSVAPEASQPAIDAAPVVTETARGDAVLPAPQAMEPGMPLPEPDLMISTDPVQPLLPETKGDVFVALPGAGASVAPDPMVPGVVPGAPMTGPGAQAQASQIAAPVSADQAAETPLPVAPAQAEPPAGDSSLPVGDAVVAPASDAPEAPASDTQPDTATEDASTSSSTFAPNPPLKMQGDTPVADSAAEAAPVSSSQEPPRIAYAAAFEPAPDLPMLAVLLIDAGTVGAGADVATALPFPVSVALSPQQGDAAARMATYRAGGIELLSLLDFPPDASPQDAATAVETAAVALPETIAVLTLNPGSLSQDGSAGLAERLARDGRGLVSADMGLNTTGRAVADAGVPVAMIYRDLDESGQDVRTMRRFLDHAASQARNSGSVVVLARLQPATISALELWSGADLAQSIQIVPVSVLLNAE